MVLDSVMDFCIPFSKSLIWTTCFSSEVLQTTSFNFTQKGKYFFSGSFDFGFEGVAFSASFPPWDKNRWTSSFMIRPSFPVPSSWLVSILWIFSMFLTAGLARNLPSIFFPSFLAFGASSVVSLALSLPPSVLLAPFEVAPASSSTSTSRKGFPTFKPHHIETWNKKY